jgi:NADPH-dependent ferric siderophore reductase
MNKLTQKAIALAETPFLKKGEVLAVREWEPGSIREIDLHLPDCDMSKWTSAQHIKCKVGVLAYRDYTPSGWDAETHTCTLLIHAAHWGAGSSWALGLEPGDTIFYRGPGSSHQQPLPARQLCFLGDETSIGHFLALRQLAKPGVSINGAILLSEAHHRQEFHDYFSGWSVEPLQKSGDGDYSELDHWVDALDPRGHAETMFYLAGYGPGVHGLRKLLRRKGIDGSRVRAQGFWA